MTIREIPIRNNFGIFVGNHGVTRRLTFNVTNGYTYKIEHIFVSAVCVLGSAAGTITISATVLGTTYPNTLFITRANLNTGPVSVQYNIPCDITMREGDSLAFDTFNSSGFNVEYFGSYQVRRIQ